MNFTVAIVGRPNVGKSTLFNRLAGRKLALVNDEPGVTRDRREHDAKLGPLEFTIVDTAGLEEADPTSLEGRMRAQTDRAIELSDVCLFMIDAREGVTPMDRHFAEILRAQGGPVLLLANKCEGAKADAGLYEAYELGLGDPIPISAEHGEGMGELAVALEAYSHDDADEDESLEWDDPKKPLRVAVVGRPNAGKSTLINTLLGEARLLTGPEAGITRDSISVEWMWQDGEDERRFKLFDTAGLRRRAKVSAKLEKLSVSDALRAIRFAEVVVVLLDAQNALEKQDLQIADLVIREGRAVVFAINKWDLVNERQATLNALRERVERLLPQVKGAPIVTLSGLTGEGLGRLPRAILSIYHDWNARVKTPDLNNWLAHVTAKHPPPLVGGRRLKIRYISQIKTRPPTFVAMCPRASEVPDSYQRYLVNALRDAFELPGVPIRLNMRKSKNPYANDKNQKRG